MRLAVTVAAVLFATGCGTNVGGSSGGGSSSSASGSPRRDTVRICDKAGYSQDQIDAGLTYARLLRDDGYSAIDFIGETDCEDWCESTWPCTSDCAGCMVAIADEAW